MLAHELGHYFQLLHTFAGTTSQIVNLTEPECHQNGDGICDTPADPGVNICPTGGCGSNFNCTQNDPLGVPYNPDATLIMSYYSCSPEKFTTQQKTVMNYALSSNPSAYAHLTGPGALDCIMVNGGNVIRNCVGFSPFEFTPLKNEPVVLANSFSNNPICGPITNDDGKYQADACNLNINQAYIVRPDKNYDGELLKGVDVADLDIIQEFLIGVNNNFTPLQMFAADANNSGTITNFDKVLIRKVIKSHGNGSHTYPVGNWRFLPQYWLLFPSFENQLNDGNPFDASILDVGTQSIRTYNPSNPLDSWMDLMRNTPNSPQGTHEEAWSFFAIKTGDVDCSAILDEEEIAPGSEPFLVPIGVNTSQVLNEIKEYNVVLSATVPIKAWQFGAMFPSNTLEVLDILEGTIGDSFDIENFDISENVNENETYLRALWNTTNGAAQNLDGKTLFRIKVKAKSSFSHLENLLLIDPKALKMVFYNGNLEQVKDFTISLEPTNNGAEEREVGTNMPKFSISPTLIDDFLRFQFNLSQNEQVSIFVTDYGGKPIINQAHTLSPGNQSIKIENLSSLPAGAYFYQIRIGQVYKTGQLIKP